MGELSFVVPAAFDGRTVNDFLRREHNVSFRLIKVLKKLDAPMGLLLNEGHTRTIDKIREGDVVCIRWPQEQLTAPALDVEVPVVYEDDWLVLFNKPQDMPTHPAKNHQENTLSNVFTAYCTARGISLPFRSVYRLDKNTSGLVAVAKDQYTASQLAGKIQKEYLAIICGCPEKEAGTIDAPIRQIDPARTLREVSPQGQRAVTHYQVLARGKGYSLVRLRLETGRTHQIRVHMAYIGHPLAGDDWYGNDSKIIDKQALHCGKCWFTHPISGEEIVAQAPFGQSFQKALENAYISYHFE